MLGKDINPLPCRRWQNTGSILVVRPNASRGLGFTSAIAAEIKQSARTLFLACVQRCSEEEASQITEEWRIQRKFVNFPPHRLIKLALVPSIQPESLKDCTYAATALLISGHVAGEHYASLPTECATSLSPTLLSPIHPTSLGP